MATKVSTTEYRSNLKRWHQVAAGGEDVLVTDRDQVVVRVTAPGPDMTLDRLERAGLLRRGRQRRPSAELDTVRSRGDSAAKISAARER